MSELLSLPRAARELGVPAQWLKAEADAKRVPCLKTGARYLFELTTLSSALVAQLRETCEVTPC